MLTCAAVYFLRGVGRDEMSAIVLDHAVRLSNLCSYLTRTCNSAKAFRTIQLLGVCAWCYPHSPDPNVIRDKPKKALLGNASLVD